MISDINDVIILLAVIIGVGGTIVMFVRFWIRDNRGVKRSEMEMPFTEENYLPYNHINGKK